MTFSTAPSTTTRGKSMMNKRRGTQSSHTTTKVIPGSDVSSFQQRMLDQLKQHDGAQQRMKRQRSSVPSSSSSSSSSPHSFIQDIHTLDDFSDLLRNADSNCNNNKNMVLVWYYAPWCTACHALRPGMEALARRHTSSTRVVQVKCDESNVAIHQGLWNIPSVPFVQLYVQQQSVTTAGAASTMSTTTMQLALEMKLNRKKLNVLHKTLQDYEDGGCSLERLGQWSVSCPYSFSYYDPATAIMMTSSSLSSTDSETVMAVGEQDMKKRLKP
jgi:thiol-disulfide isomerase/thioredoxin